jgi:hypothetical protein
VTEHKETASLLNEKLTSLALAVYTTLYYMQYCRQPFSVSGFLQHKLNFVLPKYSITCYAGNKKQSFTDAPNPELYETLKRWRDMVCSEEGLPIYLVANQHSLKEISLYLPATKNDLLRIPGFGKAKVEKFGDDILGAVESYCQRHGIAHNMDALLAPLKKESKPKSTKPKTDTKAITLSLYKEGKQTGAIAKERNLAPSTIEGHLAHFIAEGQIDVNELVDATKQKQIKEAVLIHGSLSHKTLLENLPDTISYNDIRMVLASLKQAGD